MGVNVLHIDKDMFVRIRSSEMNESARTIESQKAPVCEARQRVKSLKELGFRCFMTRRESGLPGK